MIEGHLLARSDDNREQAVFHDLVKGRRRVPVVASVLAALLAAPLGPAVAPASATATPTGSSSARAAAQPERPRLVDLSDDVVVPARTAARGTPVRRWPGTTIRYYETIPAKWQWSLDRAITHWNQAGGNIRFVEVSTARRAQVVVRYGDTQGSDGLATVGPARNGFVHLSPTYKRIDALDATNRVWVGRLFAHELGHTLGFWHTSGGCSLMVAVFNLSTCPLLADADPGYYHRRWVDKPLLTRFIDTYGGRAKRPPELGLIAPLPPQLLDVTFGGGAADDRPVALSWRTPTGVPAGAKVEVLRWLGDSCAQPPRGLSPVVRLDPAVGSWTEPEPGEGRSCYQVRIVNRYGAARPGFSAPLERWAPIPDAPVLGEIVWDPDQQAYRLTWDAPDDVTLVVQRNELDPETCLTAYDEGAAQQLFPDAGGGYWLSARAARECLTFFAVSEWHASAPTTALVAVPAPTETPAVGQVEPGVDGYAPTVTASLADDRYALRVEILAGPCPAAVPADLQWFDGWQFAPDRWELPPEASGLNCALFTAMDESVWFVLHGPVVMREFTA